MSDMLTADGAAKLLRTMSDIRILTHKNPDGDTLGSGFALWRALKLAGIRSMVVCPDAIPVRFSMLTEPYAAEADEDFEPKYTVAVDIADPGLAGTLRAEAQGAALCIDHHGSNTGYAAKLLLEPGSASCCEIIAKVADRLCGGFDRYMATALYLGVATDTGCFKFRNTTADAHMLAARTFGFDIDKDEINRLMFEQKSRNRLALEMAALEDIEFYLDGRVSVITITRDLLRRTGADPADVDGITALSRSIEGVEVGVTMRETESGSCKVSLRSHRVDSSAICRLFGGGGHPGAAGFECTGEFADIKAMLLAQVERAL